MHMKMTKKWRGLAALWLAAMMVFAMLPVGALAEAVTYTVVYNETGVDNSIDAIKVNVATGTLDPDKTTDGWWICQAQSVGSGNYYVDANITIPAQQGDKVTVKPVLEGDADDVSLNLYGEYVYNNRPEMFYYEMNHTLNKNETEKVFKIDVPDGLDEIIVRQVAHKNGRQYNLKFLITIEREPYLGEVFNMTNAAENYLKTNLDETGDTLKTKVITADDETILENGQDVHVKLTAAELKGDALAEAEKLVKALLGENVVPCYMDIALVKSSVKPGVDTTNNLVVWKSVEETNEPVKISLQIPAEMLKIPDGVQKRTFFMYRIHDGKVEKLDGAVNAGVFEFESDRFSTYVLAYEDELPEATPVPTAEPTATPPVDDLPKTGDDSQPALFAALLALSLAGMYMMLRRRNAQRG